MPKIRFIHNKAMWYRIPFFNGLAKEMEVEFIFTDEKKVECLEANYKILRRYGVHPFSVAFNLIPMLIREKYDVVVFPPPDSPGEWADNIFCFIITKIRRKPYIIWSERWRCEKIKNHGYKKFYHYVNDLLMRHICRHASANVTSGGTKQEEYFISLGVPTNKIYIAPYLSDIPFKYYNLEDIKKGNNEIFKKSEIENKKVILCVARLIKRKGVDYLIKAFAKLKEEMDNVALLIVGGACYYGYDKYYGDELRELCSNLNIENAVYFAGYVKSEDIPPYYHLCNLLVFPSIADTFADTGCLPVSDAMYFGKPVISTDVVGFAYDLIKNGINGFMVPQKDANALYSAMKKILSDPELERKMGEESKRMMEEEFTSEHMIDGFRKAIERARSNE